MMILCQVDVMMQNRDMQTEASRFEMKFCGAQKMKLETQVYKLIILNNDFRLKFCSFKVYV